MDKKYKFTGEKIIHNGRELKRIVAIRSFGEVKEGENGGYIEKESNLSHSGNAWVFGDAKVYDNGKVCENGIIRDFAEVFDYGTIRDDGEVRGQGKVYDNADIVDRGVVCDFAKVHGGSRIFDKGKVYGHCEIAGKGRVGSLKDFIYISSLGDTDGGYISFYKSRDNKIGICCELFQGTISEFKEVIKENWDSESLWEKYLSACNFAESILQKEKS